MASLSPLWPASSRGVLEGWGKKRPTAECTQEPISSFLPSSLSFLRLEFLPLHRRPPLSPTLFSSLASLTTRAAPRDLCKHGLFIVLVYILVEQERNRRVSIISRIDARSILALFSYFVLPAYPLPLFPNDKLKIRGRERDHI